MKIAVFGMGYVGCVTAACLAADGHEVWGIDKDPIKIGWLEKGIVPVRERGLTEKIRQVQAQGRLHISSASTHAIRATNAALICVGTPTDSSGRTDLSAIVAVVEEIGAVLAASAHPYTIVLRSTVPPGTTKDIILPILERFTKHRSKIPIDVYFNPEFLREGTAIDDFYSPAYTVVGTPSGGEENAAGVVAAIYGSVQAPVIYTSYQEAELLKLAANGFHALKIAFANEIGTVSAKVGASAQKVMDILVSDTKLNISPAYLRPGFAFGGSCLPKDLRSLTRLATDADLKLPLLEAILPSNAHHLERSAEHVIGLQCQTIGVVGIVFKPNTDDLRESPALKLVQLLLAAGREVFILEPELDINRLHGANLKTLQAAIPDYEARIVDWEFLKQHAELVLITRANVVLEDALDRSGLPSLRLDEIG